jgi:hypothetical protein
MQVIGFNADRTSVDIVIDGEILTVPYIVSETQLRDPQTDELTGAIVLTSPNRHCQMILDWLAEVPGRVIPDAPVAEQPNVYRLYKSTFIRRMTMAEAELFEVGIIAQPAWMRLLYNSVEYFVSSDALIQALDAELAFALGEMLGDPLAGQARADELLGPPTVQETAALTPEAA